ncbi:MAG: hypothetical protein RR348_01270, partial [Clostridia bacterium]
SARRYSFANNLFCYDKQFSFLKKGKPLEKDDEIKLEKKKFKKFRVRFHKLENVLARFTPSVIVCTTPKSHYLLSKCMQKKGLNIPTYIVSSDYTLNKSFCNPFVNGYFVQNDEVKQQLISCDIVQEKIQIIGNAVMDATFNCLDKKEIREKYGIDNTLPIISMTAGRYGACFIKKYFKIFSEYKEKFNLLVLTGNNKSFMKYIQKLSQENTILHNIFAVDQIAKIGDVLSITDALVTSPTSQVTYEAILRQIPTIVMHPLNNIEKRNFRYLVDKQLAFDGAKPQKALDLCIKLIEDADFYGASVDKLEDKLNPHATQSLCESLAKVMRQQEPIEQEPVKVEKAKPVEENGQNSVVGDVKIKKSRFAGLFNKNKK